MRTPQRLYAQERIIYQPELLTSYSQNMRTCLPTGGYASTIPCALACLQLHSHPSSASIEIAKTEGEKRMDWKTLLAYITGSVDQE